MTTIIQEPHTTLRTVATEVAPSAIASKEIQTTIERMKQALDAQVDGVAIAAPQIGERVRIFVVSPKASKTLTTHTVFINPTFVRIGKQKKDLSEGCLSVRWKYGLVKRATSATVRAYNEKGNEFVMSGRGLLAQVFQHEIDHLNGVLFIDKATNVQDIPPQE